MQLNTEVVAAVHNIMCREEMFEELCAACEVGDTPMIARYLENGVDVNGADYDSRTPMHVAAAAGHLEVRMQGCCCGKKLVSRNW